ncbi:MAG TPA: hypothetical protein VN611_16655, partial [Patescibacteria group bacterium]|nr:hypothetical protein [Patescibacteria group bacterium]
RYKDCTSLSVYSEAQNKYGKAESRFKDLKKYAEIDGAASDNTDDPQYIECQKLAIADTKDFVTYAEKILTQDPPSHGKGILPVKRLITAMAPKPKLGPKVSNEDLSKIESDARDTSTKDLALWDEIKVFWANPNSDKNLKSIKLKEYLETYDYPDWTSVEKSNQQPPNNAAPTNTTTQ